MEHIDDCKTGCGNASSVGSIDKKGIRWIEIVELLLIFLAMIGFVVGSLGWILDFADAGTIIFAAASLVDAMALACILIRTYCHEMHRIKIEKSSKLGGGTATPIPLRTHVEQILMNLSYILGASIFATGCIVNFVPNLLVEAYLFYNQGSCLFFFGATAGMIANGSPIGPLGPWCHNPKYGRIIPPILFNWIGSLLFVIGSYTLCLAWGELVGAWCFEIGSIFFMFAAWADLIGYLGAIFQSRKRSFAQGVSISSKSIAALDIPHGDNDNSLLYHPKSQQKLTFVSSRNSQVHSD